MQLGKHARPVRALMDTGAASALATEAVTRGFRMRKKGPTKWTAKGGTFQTTGLAEIPFRFPELNTSKETLWNIHVEKGKKRMPCKCDMITGVDLQQQSGSIMDWESHILKWKDDIMPLMEQGKLLDMEACHVIDQEAQEGNAVREMTS